MTYSLITSPDPLYYRWSRQPDGDQPRAAAPGRLSHRAVQASMLEVRALAKATEVLRVSQDIRAGAPKAIIVLSMVGKNYRLTKDMKDAAAVLHLPLASRPMILRQIYADAPGQGAVVWEHGRSRCRSRRRS